MKLFLFHFSLLTSEKPLNKRFWNKILKWYVHTHTYTGPHLQICLATHVPTVASGICLCLFIVTCKAVTIENGFLQVKSSGKTVTPDDDVSANETVEVKCDNGYNVKDDTDPIKCHMGKWTREFPVCQPGK